MLMALACPPAARKILTLMWIGKTIISYGFSVLSLYKYGYLEAPSSPQDLDDINSWIAFPDGHSAGVSVTLQDVRISLY